MILPDPNIPADNIRTPFVQLDDGGWTLFILKDHQMSWGHRFDPGIGYRVYIQWTGSLMTNVFTPQQTRKMANMIQVKNENHENILQLSKVLIEMAKEVDRLNVAWRALGSKPQPLHEQHTGGNA